MQKIVILGGGYGGALAATRLAPRVPVTLVDASEGLVERIRLHQVAAGDDIAPVPYSRLFGKLPVTFKQARVLSIDRKHRLVRTTAGEIPYDKLVYALGSTIDLDSVPGA
ncbi:MAG TPA: FAD-dependent oxidoreductase, partial [Thermoanaerobaculia bacterium]|nr:FAD-dependent oxidoreductase [Thermoanaerobaculia bacterium]